MAKAKEVATVEEQVGAVPAHLQQGKKASLGNVDSSDRIIPRVKLLQAISPEVTTNEDARAGHFWHTIAGVSLGKAVEFIPIVIRKSYMLWAPRGDERGILARANDAIHWDVVDEFTVKPKGSPKPVTWKTALTVQQSGLDQFGTSIPDDKDSPPAAALQYNIIGYFPEYPELSPAIILNTRSAVKKAKLLISKIEMRPVDHFGQKFLMEAVEDKGAEGPYFNYNYVASGYASEGEYKIGASLYEQFKEADFRASDEADESREAGATYSDAGAPF